MTAKQIGGDHYAKHAIQPWDALPHWLGTEGFKAYLAGNVIKYIARHKDKGGVQDLEKARHYLDKLIDDSTGPTWQRWTKPGMPCAPETMIEVRTLDGNTAKGPASIFTWSAGCGWATIVEWREISPAA